MIVLLINMSENFPLLSEILQLIFQILFMYYTHQQYAKYININIVKNVEKIIFIVPCSSH